MLKKTILIFGSTGQIGRHLIRKLTKNNYKVICQTRNAHKAIYLKTSGQMGYVEIKEANIFDLSQQNILAITIPVTGLSDWLKIQRKLATVFLITGLDIVLLSLDEIRVNIHYVGKMRQLNTALRQFDLNLKIIILNTSSDKNITTLLLKMDL